MQGFRSATGVIVVSTALLIGSASGAIAAADTGTGDSTSRSTPAREASAEKPASNSSSNSSSNSAESRKPGSLLSRESNSTQSSAADADADDAISAASDAEEESGGSVAAIEDASVEAEQTGSVQIGDLSILDVLPRATESGSVESGSVESGPVDSGPVVTEAPEPAVSVSASGSSDAGTVAATATKPNSTASDSPAPPAAAISTATPDGSTSQDKPTRKLDTSPAARPPRLEDVLAAMNTSMTSLGNTLTTVVVTLGNTVATVVISMGNAAAAIPPAIWALPTSQTPVSDVIVLVKTILSSVAESATAVLGSATAVLKLPSDIAALFGLHPTGTNPATIGDASDRRLDLATGSTLAMGPPAASQFLPGIPEQRVDVFDSRSGVAAFAPAAVAALSAPLQAVTASVPGRAGEYQSLFDRAFGALLVPLSLWALATGALPGLLGLLVVFGVGTRVGYRQAKAGFALKVSGIARFAGPGPLGVVRSGSIVALHPRRGGRPAPRWHLLGDQAA